MTNEYDTNKQIKTENQCYLERIKRTQTGKGVGGREKLLLVW